ncbi:MAG: tyrosine-type recombinase/integrase [Spirochaetia bacterium]|jgi:integrase
MARKKYPEPFKRGARYYFTSREGKKRINVATGLTAKEEARDFIRNYIDTRAGGTGETFRAYAEPYFIWPTCPRTSRLLGAGQQIGETHVRKARRWLERFVFTDPTFSALPMREIRRHHVLELLERLRERVPRETHGTSKGLNTTNKVLEVVKIILSEAYYREDIAANPGAGVGKLKEDRRQRDILTPEETAQLLALCPGEMKSNLLTDALVVLLATTGMRSAEARALRWENVDLQTGRVRIVEAFKDSANRTLGLPKWNKSREIVLPKMTSDRLRAWRQVSHHTGDEDKVLATIDGRALGVTGIKGMIARAMAAAENEKLFKLEGRQVTPHCFRHALNTYLLAAGVSPLLVQSYLGWTSAEARILTRIQTQYTRLSLLRLEDVAKAIDKMYGSIGKRRIAKGA